MKHSRKFRHNPKFIERQIMQRKLETDLKKLEIADKIAQLLLRDNQYETYKSF